MHQNTRWPKKLWKKIAGTTSDHEVKSTNAKHKTIIPHNAGSGTPTYKVDIKFQ